MYREHKGIDVVAALAQAGVSQAELARRIGSNGTTVNRWCVGRAPVSRMAWLAVLSALGLPSDWQPPAAAQPSTPAAST